MIFKGLLLLLASLLVTTVVALFLPWRTQGTIHPGQTRYFEGVGDFVIRSTSSGPGKEYYDLEKLAQKIEQSSQLEATGGLQVLEPRSRVTPTTVTWTEGSKSSRREYRAPGASLLLSGSLQAPEGGGPTRVERVTWRSTFLEADLRLLLGVTMKRGNLVWHGDRLTLGHWIVGSGASYWVLCAKKAFVTSLPLAIVLFGAAAMFTFGRNVPSGSVPEPGSGKVRFAARYETPRMVFAIMLFAIFGGMSIFAVVNLLSNAGDHLEDHTTMAAISVVALVLTLAVTALSRFLTAKEVEITPDALRINKGDGWRQPTVIPWAEVRDIDPLEHRKSGRILYKSVTIKRATGGREVLKSTGTDDYEALLPLLFELRGRAGQQ